MDIDQFLNELSGDMGMGAMPDIVGAQIVGAPQAVATPENYIMGDLLAGFPVTSIGATTTAPIVFNPAISLRARKLVLGVSARVALSRVESIFVNAINQNVGNGPAPCDAFTADQTFNLKGDTVQPGQGATLNITNGTAAAIIYEGFFSGPVARAQRAA